MGGSVRNQRFLTPRGSSASSTAVGVIALLGVTLLLVTAPSAQAAEPDFTITRRPGEPPEFDSYIVSAALRAETPRQHLEYNLTTPNLRLIGRIVSYGYFDVERPRQVVPEVDDHFFFEMPRGDVVDPRSGGRLWNGTKSGSTVTIDVAFFVQAGRATLNLTRDVTPPTLSVGEPYNLQPYSFLLGTETNEYAMAWLWYWPKGSDREPIPLPTTIYALEQTFPVQGLDENTTYAYRLDVFDWAENHAPSAEYEVTTPPLVAGPEPIVLARSPVGEFPAGTLLRAVEANYTTPVGAIDPAMHVRLFVDLTEVTHAASITANRVRYVPDEPFGPGFHRVGLEIANSEGGETVEQWTFCLEHCSVGGAGDPQDVPAAGVGLALLAFALARRRRAA